MAATPIQSEQEISDNDIDDHNDFDKELPFEVEYYRTSTDRDLFVRPIASPDSNDIDDGADGINLDDASTLDCTYHISIKLFYESIDDFDLKVEGLKVAKNPKNNITLCEFVRGAKTQIFFNIKGKNVTNELVSEIVTYLRQTFMSTFGYEDYCGVSTNVETYFTKNDTQVDLPQFSGERTTEIPAEVTAEAPANVPAEVDTEVPAKAAAKIPTKLPDRISSSSSIVPAKVPVEDEVNVDIQSETEISDTETTTEIDESDATEEYQPKILTRPKLSEAIQDVIKVYKTLNNWKYPQHS